MKTNAEKVRDMFGFLTISEFMFLKALVLFNLTDNREPVIVNIGAGYGTSGLLFLETSPFARVYTIDIQDELSPNGSLAAERAAVGDAGMMDQLGVRWFQIHADSKAAAKEWSADTPIDLLFIDGDHSYEGCKADIQAWRGFVKPGGCIAIHDYRRKEAFWKRNPDAKLTPEKEAQIASGFPGVDRAVEESFDLTDALIVDSLVFVRVSD